MGLGTLCQLCKHLPELGIFIETPSLQGLPTKAEDAPSWSKVDPTGY